MCQRITPLLPFHTEEEVNDDFYNLWVCASMNKNQNIMNDIINACEPVNIAKVAGSGNKILQLLDQKLDYYINLVPGFKYWDMCASDALIQARMGIVTDANQNPILYDPTSTNFTIKEGIVVAKNTKVYQLCQSRIYKNLGKSIATLHKEVLAECNRLKKKNKDITDPDVNENKQQKVIQLNPKVFNTYDPTAQRNVEILSAQAENQGDVRCNERSMKA